MFFATMKKLLDGAQAVTVIIVPAEDGRIGVTVAPKMGEKADPALARPISLVGSAEELDAEWPQLIGGLSVARKSLAEQLASATAALEAAKKPAPKAAGKAPTKPAATSIDDLVPDDEGGDEGEGQSTVPAPTPASNPVPASGGFDLSDLLS